MGAEPLYARLGSSRVGQRAKRWSIAGVVAVFGIAAIVVLALRASSPAPIQGKDVVLPRDAVEAMESKGSKSKAAYAYWKIANGGITTWRPAVEEVQLFSDTSCTRAIAIPANGGWDTAATACPASGCDLCSSWDDKYGNLGTKGCQLAIDGDASTSWRPRGGNTHGTGTVWMTFRLPRGIMVQCIKAPNLGSGSFGGMSWNGGLQVSTSTDAENWEWMTRDASLSGTDKNAFAWQAADSGKSKKKATTKAVDSGNIKGKKEKKGATANAAAKGEEEPCASKFIAPPKPETYKATQHNGVKLQDVCYTGKGPFHVFIIGDWGGKKDSKTGKIAAVSHLTHRWNKTENFQFIWPTDQDCQWLVAEEMRKRAPKSKPDYILNMGDNFYWGGVEDYCTGDMFKPYSAGGSPVYQQDKVDQFKEVFEDVYYGAGIDSLQWLGVLGNHDYGGWRFDMAWDQAVGYTWSDAKTSKGRWMTPALYYRVKVRYPDFSIDYWFLDTNVWDALPYGEKPPHNICGPHTPGDATCNKSGGPKSLDDCQGWFHRLWDEQKKWLDQTVPESKAEWRIIVTHFPPYWGKKEWIELAPKHEIDAVITGHRHAQNMHCKDDQVTKIWQEDAHSTELNDFLDPTAWVVSGGGGGITSEHIPDPAGNDDQYGFVDLTVAKDQLVFEALSHKGKLRKRMVVDHSYSHGGINKVTTTTPKPTTNTEAKAERTTKAKAETNKKAHEKIVA